ncbi:MAG: arginyltransferase [Nitrosomonas sp.]|nr:arginyltransferase [Nitrosomonas sp.]MDP1951152.1 arginyltransferase [Nitrosomonas sp.]
MNLINDARLAALRFHTTQPYPCSYLPGKLARAQVATPDRLIDTHRYEKLIQVGFRRSGSFTYRPSCDHCHACIPARVSVNEFTPNRTQRRTWKRYQHLAATLQTHHFHPDHFSLYQRYQLKHHGNTGMDCDDREQYHDFLLQSNINTQLIEFHENGQLRMISIVDQLSNGLSSVYTFYDPDEPNASFGTYNILWQIAQCRELNLPYVYLGYWIKENRKMSYKANFQPLEVLIDTQWRPFASIESSF